MVRLVSADARGIGKPATVEHSEWLQRRLAVFNHRRLVPALPGAGWRAELREETGLRDLEGKYLERERETIAPLLAELPLIADAFMSWFERLRETGPGQNDALFPWLAGQASMAEMRWFLTQEVAGEAGFEDLVAMTQLRFPTRAKLELARNYWDEMGRGHEDGMHGPMLTATAVELKLEPSVDGTVCEALALANMMVALAANRRYAYQAIGALGVIEMTAPGRVAMVNTGLRRLGVTARGRRYFQLHAGLDIKHSEAWNAEVIRPLAESDPAIAHAIAEGALLRLRCGARCFERYRQELGFTAEAAPRRRLVARFSRAGRAA